MTKDQLEDASPQCPRPALGRRPWFALLRRAWILRRFALAMTGERTRHRDAAVRAVVVEGDGTSSGPLLVMRSARPRRLGLRPVPGPFGGVFTGRSLTGWAMAEPVRWFGITDDGVVAASGTLRPGGVVVAPRPVRLMIEVPVWIAEPPVGARLAAVPILAAWPDD